LNELEEVMLSNGHMKLIKDIIIGDEIICFNPKTMKTAISKVINHYNRITNKIVYNIKILSGRTITATHDHKFMTNQGWVQVKDFDETVKLGIIINSEYSDNTNTVQVVNVINNRDLEIINNPNFKELKNNHYYMPIIARLAGFYSENTLSFVSTNDKNAYNNDAITIGFSGGYYDVKFELFINYVLASVEDWLPVSSSLVKREFVAGYFSNNIYNKYNNLVEQILNEYQLSTNWLTTHDNTVISNYYSKFGICYNTKRLHRIAVIYEYTQYNLEKYKSDTVMPDYTLDEFKQVITITGNLMFIPFLFMYVNNNNRISDLTIENSDYHSFIGGNGFAVSNCAMGKQALGIYMSNFNNRTDTMGNIINYPQKPIVSTKLSKYTYNNELPSGVNAIVAIMTHTGFNQEDSVMINKSALDRGLFTSTYYKIFRDQCTKNHSSGEEEIFVNPKNLCPVKPYSYDKLGEDGFIPKNTYVDNGDIIVGKVMPRKMNGKTTYQDNSISMKSNDDGYIDMNYTGTNSEGYKFCKIKIRKNRKPEVGDKVASRSAQKGSIGMIYDHKDMPFTKDGIVPDIIINPHAIPSRMTMAQLMECIMGKVSCFIGAYGDSTPFTNCTVEDIAKNLEKTGLEKHGNEIMYNGRTGEQIKTEIFIGPTYYQRLKHMVTDKIHCLTKGHEVLTTNSWKDISEITMDDEVATLKDGKLVYEKPLEIHHYPNYKGKMYKVENKDIDIEVTANHRMFISSCNNDYKLEKAEDIVGKIVKYKQNADWDAKDYQFIIPAFNNYQEKIINMNYLISIIGTWIAEGQVYISLKSDNHQLYDYVNQLSIDKLPEWIWKLSKKQAQQLVLCNSFNYYKTISSSFADDIMRLLLHAGWSGMKSTDDNKTYFVNINKNNEPYVNKTHKDDDTYYYEGSVYCLSVSSEVFMVRRNGKPVWTGNSRGSNGPIVMLTRQCSEGRARGGGLRLGEMERDCFIGHGSALFLKEKMLDCADNYRVFICKDCGMIANVNPEKNIYKCTHCKNATDIVQIRIPYAFKLLTQELNTMNVIMRYICQ
jgi:hypothetical protein